MALQFPGTLQSPTPFFSFLYCFETAYGSVVAIHVTNLLELGLCLRK